MFCSNIIMEFIWIILCLQIESWNFMWTVTAWTLVVLFDIDVLFESCSWFISYATQFSSKWRILEISKKTACIHRKKSNTFVPLKVFILYLLVSIFFLWVSSLFFHESATAAYCLLVEAYVEHVFFSRKHRFMNGFNASKMLIKTWQSEFWSVMKIWKHPIDWITQSRPRMCQTKAEFANGFEFPIALKYWE